MARVPMPEPDEFLREIRKYLTAEGVRSAPAWVVLEHLVGHRRWLAADVAYRFAQLEEEGRLLIDPEHELILPPAVEASS